MLGGHCIKGWAKTQAVLALSSAEAGLYASVKASAEALGLASVMKDLGRKVKGIEVIGDASAALGIIKRQGLGKLRHIEVGYLCLQDAVAEKRLSVHKCRGEDNPADLGTKHLSGEVIQRHLITLGYHLEDGRFSVVPET